MEVDYNKKEKIVGTFVIGIVILLFAMLIIIGRGKDWFKTYITYYTTFEESYNLKENAAVKLYKADIGKVKKITLTEDKVRVELVILEDYSSRIRSDSVAIVDSPTFIGSEYISIIPVKRRTKNGLSRLLGLGHCPVLGNYEPNWQVAYRDPNPTT